MQRYKNIFILNVSFNILTKTATIRHNLVIEHVIHHPQTAFMQGRNIQDGVVTLHETMHELHQKFEWEVILKIEFQKPYDKFNWSFSYIESEQKFFSNSCVCSNP
jgi:endonuclease IV